MTNFTIRLALFCCCLTQITQAQTFPVTPLMNNGADTKHINFIVLGDGYQANEQTTFISDANGILNDLFSQSPFSEYKNFFNVYAIEVPSNESGADHPGTATDVVEPLFTVQDVDNYFGSTFDAFGIHRLLVPMNSTNIINVLASNFPSYDQVMVVVNSPQYGGSGGWLATSSTNNSASEIAIHELGHSFAGLADEYWAGANFAAEKPNMTQDNNPTTVKWADWMNVNNIGTYEHGLGSVLGSWFRPHQSCKMRFLGSPFCSVCTETIIDQIYSLVSPIENAIPAINNVVYNGLPLDFSLDLIYPNPNTLSIEWQLNGTVVNASTNVLTLAESQLTLANNTLSVTVTDNTLLSKSYLPNSGYVFTHSWNVENPNINSNTGEVILASGLGKFFFKAFPNPTADQLTVNYFYNNSPTDLSINVLSIDGKQMSSSQQAILTTGEGQFLIDLADFPTGIYVVNLQTKLFRTSFEVIKN